MPVLGQNPGFLQETAENCEHFISKQLVNGKIGLITRKHNTITYKKSRKIVRSEIAFGGQNSGFWRGKKSLKFVNTSKNLNRRSLWMETTSILQVFGNLEHLRC